MKNNVILLWSVIALMLSAHTIAQDTVYSKVKIFINNPSEIERLVELGIDLDHPEFEKDNSISLFLNAWEMNMLSEQQFNYKVIIPDFREFYATLVQNDQGQIATMQRSASVADGFDLGSMGGFYTFSEVEGKLDEMFQNYPNLVTSKVSIGTTLEGRPIWMVKISDNPTIDEPEPAVYFDGLHHAREPLSMATCINFMFWLLENYDSDPSVQFLVNSRELYFVPVVNPDGYVYNEQTDPNGGGLWRKNRRPDPGGCVGVDLNRNYAFGYNNNGNCSSGDPCSGTYRGPSAFSEPETTAVSNFMNQVAPNTGFSIHSTAGSYLMPYGFDTSPPAFEIYSEWASSFLDGNDYPYGVTFQMLGYTSCGTTRDYMHSEGIYGWTPEIDGDGFWPTPSTIFDLVGENVRPMYYQSFIAGGYLDVQSHTQIGDALPGGSFDLVVEIKNVGVGASAEIVSVILEASVPEVMVPTASSYGTVAARSKKDNAANPFTISIDPSFTGTSFLITASTYQDGVLNEVKEIPILVGNATPLFTDDAENGSASWNASGNGISWGQVADDSYSGDFSFGDSDGGNAENNSLNYFELSQSFDFTQTITPVVSFATKWSLEGPDYAAFQISTDVGTTWVDLQEFNENNDWTNLVFVLDDYKNFTDVRFRFKMFTDNSLPADGFYFDDFRLMDYDTDILGYDPVENSAIRVYPNPFNSEISISMPAGVDYADYKFSLFDLAGRQIQTDLIKSSNTVILSTPLSAGIYFLKVYDKHNKIVLAEKMIKN